MRLTSRFLATALNTTTSPIKPATPLALLPPMHLYRRLLRTHRKHLGLEERIFGDEYVKAEFRRHRDIENPIHIVGFLTQWQLYAQQLEGDEWKGRKLDTDVLDKLSDQQVGQLYELMMAIQRRDVSDETDAEEPFATSTDDGQGRKV